MEIEYPTRETIPQLHQLWQTAFQDTDNFLERFFQKAYSPRRCRCLMEQGRVAAALYWFDGEYAGNSYAYLYAVATRPDARGRGLCRALMADTHSLLASLGYAGSLLMPENPPLRQMYRRRGYRDCCSFREFTFKRGDPIPIRPVTAGEYAALRRALLPRGGMIQEGANLAFLESYAQLYAGDHFLLAAAEDGRFLQGLELLGDPQAASGILGALDKDAGFFRTPGAEKQGPMLLPLIPDLPAPDYFGLIFD